MIKDRQASTRWSILAHHECVCAFVCKVKIGQSGAKLSEGSVNALLVNNCNSLIRSEHVPPGMVDLTTTAQEITEKIV